MLGTRVNAPGVLATLDKVELFGVLAPDIEAGDPLGGLLPWKILYDLSFTFKYLQ